MSLVNGQTVDQSDFIKKADKNAAPLNDLNRVPKLEFDAKVHSEFTSGPNVIAVVAGVDLSTNQVVFLSDTVLVTDLVNTNLGSTIDTGSNNTYYRSNVYTTPNTGGIVSLKRFRIYITEGSGGSGGTNFGRFTMEIKAVDGSDLPTGAALFTSSNCDINTWTFGNQEVLVEFASAATLSPNTKYAFIIKYTSTDTDQILLMGGGTPAGYVTSQTSTDGSAWTVSGGAYYFVPDWYFGTAGKVYKTSALYHASSNILGFCQYAVSSGATAFVIERGQVEGLSGLTPSAVHYLSDTYGALGAVAGTISKKVAYALASNKIAFRMGGKKYQNQYLCFSGSSYIAPVTGMYVPQTTGTFTILDGVAGSTVQSIPASMAVPVQRGQVINKEGYIYDDLQTL